MATSSLPRHQNESIQNLQTECHYLSLALNRLNEKTADPEEYNFLKQKLVSAEEQLHMTMSAAASNNEEEKSEVVDDYSYNDNGPTNNTATYDSKMQAYYAATNTYRQQLQALARSYGERSKGSKNKRRYKIDDDDDDDSSSSSSSSDSDDSSVGSANRHINRNYRKTLLVEKSRDIFNKYHHKSQDYYERSKENIKQSSSSLSRVKIKDIHPTTSWIKFILLAMAFLLVVLSIALRYRPRMDGKSLFGDVLGGGTSSNSGTATTEPCATFTLSLKTDRFGNETSWDITRKVLIANSSSSTTTTTTTFRPLQYHESTIKSGGPYKYGKRTTITGHTEQIHESFCLPMGEYNFILHDKMGDGICCDYGRGQYGLRIGEREIRPMSDGLFLGKEEVSSFEITGSDVGVVIGSDSIASESSTVGEDDGNSSSSSNNGNHDNLSNEAATTTTTTSTTINMEEQTANDQPSPGVNTEETDDSDLGLGLDDGLNGGMGDDSLLDGAGDDLITTLETQSDDAVDPLLYYNIEHMDSNADGKVSKEEYAKGTEEISEHCSLINVLTSLGRKECERVCGEDHYCCFQPTLGGYDCKEDPSFACEAFKPCEILFKSDTAEHQVSISESSESPSGQTAQEMALIEESVYQYCSSGTAGIGLTKCQEICHDHLCCFEKNFGVGLNCDSAYAGLCPYYAGCEIMASSSSHWTSINTSPNLIGLDMNDTAAMSAGSGNQNEDFLDPIPTLTMEEKLQMQDLVDQACSEFNIGSGSGQCGSLCQAYMCCFDSSQHGCNDYDPMCPFVSSCEKMLFLGTQPMNTDFDPMLEEGFIGNRKRLRG